MVANLLSKKAKRLAARKALKEEKVSTKEELTLDQDTVDQETNTSDEDEEPILEDSQNTDQESEDEDDIKEQEQYIPKNDEDALRRLTDKLRLKDLPWIETMQVTSTKPIEIKQDDNQDQDMARELAFYQQALEAARIARDKFKELDVPFSRPDDYYAEMLKSDEHMAKIRQRLLDEAARNKASEEAKRQRLLKKFGKKVQVQKQLDRQKEKAQTLDKIKLLKRKRADGNNESLTLDNDFDVALENADNKRQKKDDNKKGKPTKRQIKDKKYGFGGKRGKYHKSNTAESSADIGGPRKRSGAGGKRGGKGGRR
ncbi:putative rRNA-processing protein ebp2 [Halteromyces radiatus]|uniref:putative rRNA-processing protein ebp2 n=1 Tax=Halteromyces radiatus TaxID=101107 RepID=UPI0022212694|nr:putative rRNA-processing protein ebp2 [Halteromyces radiatus]KAI8092567.1 putative rRNA-processing protein ebp2 [Halteromyces radiatus]